MCTVLIEGGSVALGPVAVLKFGSSLLAGAEGFRVAAEEVRRHVRLGYRVVAVVSAMRGATDRLLETVSEITDRPAGGFVAHLLRTGEEASGALLGIALTEVGMHAHVQAVDVLGLRTVGPLHDAEPVDADFVRLVTCLRDHEAVVVPGFIGADGSGSPSLLGRGGSDLTALFLAGRLGAEEVRLIKDVDGVHPWDPGSDRGTSSALPAASWQEVARVGNGVVQEKALRFAERRGLEFRVAAPGGEGTLVGSKGAS